MKQIRLIAALVCLLFLCGCSGRFGKGSPHFYYLRNDIEFTGSAGVIASDASVSVDPTAELLPLLEQYLSGPDDGSLRSPFPEDVLILRAEQQDAAVILEFNDRLGTLTGMELTLACACVTMTCLELTDAESVTIRAAGTTLDGAAQITMDESSLLLLDSSGQ